MDFSAWRMVCKYTFIFLSLNLNIAVWAADDTMLSVFLYKFETPLSSEPSVCPCRRTDEGCSAQFSLRRPLRATYVSNDSIAETGESTLSNLRTCYEFSIGYDAVLMGNNPLIIEKFEPWRGAVQLVIELVETADPNSTFRFEINTTLVLDGNYTARRNYQAVTRDDVQLELSFRAESVTTSAYYDALLAVISVLAILSASLLVISVSLIVILWWSMRHPSRKAPKKTGEEGITRSQRTLSNSYEPPQTASIQLEIESGPERKSEELKTGNSQTDPKSVITDTREATKTTDTTESEKKPETQKKADVVPAVHRMIKQIESSSSIETQQAKRPSVDITQGKRQSKDFSAALEKFTPKQQLEQPPAGGDKVQKKPAGASKPAREKQKRGSEDVTGQVGMFGRLQESLHKKVKNLGGKTPPHAAGEAKKKKKGNKFGLRSPKSSSASKSDSTLLPGKIDEEDEQDGYVDVPKPFVEVEVSDGYVHVPEPLKKATSPTAPPSSPKDHENKPLGPRSAKAQVPGEGIKMSQNQGYDVVQFNSDETNVSLQPNVGYGLTSHDSGKISMKPNESYDLHDHKSQRDNISVQPNVLYEINRDSVVLGNPAAGEQQSQDGEYEYVQHNARK